MFRALIFSGLFFCQLCFGANVLSLNLNSINELVQIFKKENKVIHFSVSHLRSILKYYEFIRANDSLPKQVEKLIPEVMELIELFKADEAVLEKMYNLALSSPNHLNAFNELMKLTSDNSSNQIINNIKNITNKILLSEKEFFVKSGRYKIDIRYKYKLMALDILIQYESNETNWKKLIDLYKRNEVSGGEKGLELLFYTIIREQRPPREAQETIMSFIKEKIVYGDPGSASKVDDTYYAAILALENLKVGNNITDTVIEAYKRVSDTQARVTLINLLDTDELFNQDKTSFLDEFKQKNKEIQKNRDVRTVGWKEKQAIKIVEAQKRQKDLLSNDQYKALIFLTLRLQSHIPEIKLAAYRAYLDNLYTYFDTFSDYNVKDFFDFFYTDFDNRPLKKYTEDLKSLSNENYSLLSSKYEVDFKSSKEAVRFLEEKISEIKVQQKKMEETRSEITIYFLKKFYEEKKSLDIFNTTMMSEEFRKYLNHFIKSHTRKYMSEVQSRSIRRFLYTKLKLLDENYDVKLHDEDKILLKKYKNNKTLGVHTSRIKQIATRYNILIPESDSKKVYFTDEIADTIIYKLDQVPNKYKSSMRNCNNSLGELFSMSKMKIKNYRPEIFSNLKKKIINKIRRR